MMMRGSAAAREQLIKGRELDAKTAVSRIRCGTPPASCIENCAEIANTKAGVVVLGLEESSDDGLCVQHRRASGWPHE